jgi:acyl carrier protein
MELDNVAQELRTFIRVRFGIPDDDPEFNDDVHLFDYGYVDSFGAVELNSFVEKEFAVKVSSSDLIAFPLNTVKEIATFVVKRRNREI